MSRRGGGGAGRSMVPAPDFRSYYGRPIVKAPPWKHDIPAYLFTGGLAAGSALLAAGGDATGRPALRRTGRVTGRRVSCPPAASSAEPAASPPVNRYAAMSCFHGGALTIGRP